jgi:ribosomal protein L11 methylase PrmA
VKNFLIPDPIRIRQYSDNMNFQGAVLEIGADYGILAKVALERAAARVVAVDINPYAVENCEKACARRRNFSKRSFFPKLMVLLTTLFLQRPGLKVRLLNR